MTHFTFEISCNSTISNQAALSGMCNKK